MRNQSQRLWRVPCCTPHDSRDDSWRVLPSCLLSLLPGLRNTCSVGALDQLPEASAAACWLCREKLSLLAAHENAEICQLQTVSHFSKERARCSLADANACEKVCTLQITTAEGTGAPRLSVS